MDRICDARNTEYSLRIVGASLMRMGRRGHGILIMRTSVDPGNIPSLALSRAPEAS